MPSWYVFAAVAVFVATAKTVTGATDENVCANPLHWSGTKNVTIPVNGENRTFELFVPFQGHGECGIHQWCTGPPNSSSPLVINWHGCNGHMPLVDYHTTISKVADAAKDFGYYAIHPVGTSETPDVYGSEWGWNAPGIPCGKVGVDDFAFFEAILSFAEKELCVDLSRVHTTGFSTGAFLSYGLACRYPGRIAAAATDAGGLSHEEYDTCAGDPSGGAVPMQSFHSLADPTVPYNGTTAWAGQDAMNALWRLRNGCTEGVEQPSVTVDTETTTCQRWDCPAAPVEACALKNIDHCWYGGRSGGFQSCAPRSGDVDATAHMFQFWEELAARRLGGTRWRPPAL
jgi:polyhydroxybutyrate depolymerase